MLIKTKQKRFLKTIMPENVDAGLCPASKPRNLRKKSCVKLTKKKVLKMLAVMEPHQQATGDPVNSHSQEFLTSGRTGRRNALPDILSEHAVVTSADLPARLQGLTTTDGASSTAYGKSPPDGAGTSKQRENARPNGNS